MNDAETIGRPPRPCNTVRTTCGGDVSHLSVVPTIGGRAGAEWDAAITKSVAGEIIRYLRENPPPPDAYTASEWRRYAQTLMAQADVRLAAVRHSGSEA